MGSNNHNQRIRHHSVPDKNAFDNHALDRKERPRARINGSLLPAYLSFSQGNRRIVVQKIGVKKNGVFGRTD